MSNENLIEEECCLIKDLNKCQTNDQMKQSFDKILIQLNENGKLLNSSIVQQIVLSISFRLNNDQTFRDENLLEHQIFVMIRKFYLNLFNQWKSNQFNDQISSELFIQIGKLFYDLSCLTDNRNVHALVDLLINPLIITELCQCLKEIGVEGKHLNDENVESIDYLIRGISLIEKGRVEIQSMDILSKLVEHIVNCLCSNIFIQMFKQIDEKESFNATERLLLDTSTDFLCWHDAGLYNSNHIAIRNSLLYPYIEFFQKDLLRIFQLNKITLKMLGQLSITLIGGNANDEEIFPSNIRQGYLKMIDQLAFLLNLIVEREDSNELTIILTQCLYSLTMTNDLRQYIQNKHFIPLLLKLTDQDDQTIQFHVYRILAAILTEDDIKTLANPNKIANVFRKFLINLIDDPTRRPRFYNLLRSLKILIQHDQIKEELIKEEILPILIRCATDSKFDQIKVHLPSLEILLALTFNDKAKKELKTNNQFLSDLNLLINQSKEQRLQRVAEGIIWKLEKESKDISSSSINNNKTYNVMISYSYSDKDLSYQIHQHLLENQIRVWIDKDHMHGQTMVAMANAIENSQFVLICMSDAYKRSAYCQSEAHYAFERKCLLIPLIMKPNYRPDGWLGILVSGKIYIDFPKLGFQLGYDKLINEINRHQTNPSTKPIQHHIQIDNHSHLQQTITKDYPNNLDQWTTDHVRAFLINEKFQILLPVLSQMNGRLLHQTYDQCQTHYQFMFQTFQSEISASGQQQTLTLYTYISFIDQIEKFIPNRSKQNSQTTTTTSSSFCILI